MQVNPNNSSGEVSRTEPYRLSLPATKVEHQQTDFTHVAALNNALQDVPPVRIEEVERAKKLIQDANYPPPYALVRIAHLLAMNWSDESE
jgi:hypothetical protein